MGSTCAGSSLAVGKEHGLRHPLASETGWVHATVAAKFGVEFVCVAGPCRAASLEADSEGAPTAGKTTEVSCDPYSREWGAVFLVASIGQGRACHGFEMGAFEVRT
jgi:hypothetical protein